MCNSYISNDDKAKHIQKLRDLLEKAQGQDEDSKNSSTIDSEIITFQPNAEKFEIKN